jgi:hypothetical protein
MSVRERQMRFSGDGQRTWWLKRLLTISGRRIGDWKNGKQVFGLEVLDWR